jgi:hypothetical protein
MRFMMIVKASADSEKGIIPAPEAFKAMGKFNEDLIDAGILLAAEGLYPSDRGSRVTFNDGKHVVRDGPFAETKELVSGFWIIQVKSHAEALQWVRRIPMPNGETIELRRVFEAADFAEHAPEEEVAKEQAWRDANQKPISG